MEVGHTPISARCAGQARSVPGTGTRRRAGAAYTREQKTGRRPGVGLASATPAVTVGLKGRKEAVLERRALVDPVEDLLRVPQSALRRDEDRNRASTACESRRDPVEALDVRLLAVGESRPLERPPGLLAVVADRDRDEPQHPRRSIGFGREGGNARVTPALPRLLSGPWTGSP